MLSIGVTVRGASQQRNFGEINELTAVFSNPALGVDISVVGTIWSLPMMFMSAIRLGATIGLTSAVESSKLIYEPGSIVKACSSYSVCKVDSYFSEFSVIPEIRARIEFDLVRIKLPIAAYVGLVALGDIGVGFEYLQRNSFVFNRTPVPTSDEYSDQTNWHSVFLLGGGGGITFGARNRLTIWAMYQWRRRIDGISINNSEFLFVPNDTYNVWFGVTVSRAMMNARKRF